MHESTAGDESDKRLTDKYNRVVEVVTAHSVAETVTKSIDETMATMTSDPYLYFNAGNQVAVGRNDVREFYIKSLIGQYLPPDGEMITASFIVGENHVIGEIVARFTHTIQMNWLVPGIPPTGKKVELALAVVVEVRDGKVANERAYWDQASLLFQLGLLDRGSLPIAGAEGARTLLKLKGVT